MGVNESSPAARNPGPPWGYAFLRLLDSMTPRVVTRALVGFGTIFAVAAMKRQRRWSAEYLELMFARPPGFVRIWRHFFAFSELLLTRLRVGTGRRLPPRLSEPNEEYMRVIRSKEPCLFGTFHVGHSDLVGFLLADFERPVTMIRLRVGNSSDTDLLGRSFGRWIQFVWVNEPENLLYAIKDALHAGRSVAMKCDRIEYTSKSEAFLFLGKQRLFPFTIYHLSVLFGVPVVFAFAVPDGPDGTRVHGPPIFRPDPTVPKEQNLARGRDHFQDVLFCLEKTLHANPYLWFNFLPMNPEASPTTAAPPAAPRPSSPPTRSAAT